MRYLYIRHNASIMAMSIICPPEGPLDTSTSTRTTDLGRTIMTTETGEHYSTEHCPYGVESVRYFKEHLSAAASALEGLKGCNSMVQTVELQYE